VYITMTAIRVLVHKSVILCYDRSGTFCVQRAVRAGPFFMRVHDRPEIVAFLEKWDVSADNADDVAVFEEHEYV